jgi:uncharacterized protein YbjT (DUF2867 family)
MYVITGATGNIGKRISELLLEKGQRVRAIGRSLERLRPLADKGVEARVGLLEDPEFVMHSFRGATAVFSMIPPNNQAEDLMQYQKKVGESLAQAILNSGVKQVVNLSSMGAERSEKTGPILSLHFQEQRLNDLNSVNVLHLRPCSFMENQLWNIPLIKNMGICGSAERADLISPHIATQDIAEVASQELLSGIKGKSVRELVGPEDLSMIQITRILGKAIGKEDLQYVQFSYEDAEKGMIDSGLSPSAAKLIVEMQRSMNETDLAAPIPRTEKNTTKTTMQEFAQVFAAIYGGR